jgi:uncharacterized membrane protein
LTQAINALLLLLTLTYPVAVYWGLGHLEPRWIALALGGLVLARLFAPRAASFGPRRTQALIAAAAVALALLAFAGNAALPLKLYPVAVNAVLLLVFAASLRGGPTAVERIARLRDPALPEQAVRYTRLVTQAWCVFFFGNGALALLTALAASDRVWMIYNGALAYGLIGAMFGGEWLIRRRVMRKWRHA